MINGLLISVPFKRNKLTFSTIKSADIFYKKINKMKNIKMKNILIFLCLITFCSCGYRVEQEVSSNIFNNKIVLQTKVVKCGMNERLVQIWIDNVDFNTCDSIKCVRYKNAVEVKEKIEHLESVNCE